MKVSLRWLRQHLKTDLNAEEVLDLLTDLGLEVEEPVDLGMGSGLLVVGNLLSVDKHPDADKLTLCSVDVGEDKPLSIVCGATNHKKGDNVPVARIGMKLPNGMKLKPTKIRGVASEGMLCSGVELNWSDDASGILILPDTWKPGEPFDFLFEVSITANRPDCMSIFGLARDMAAAQKKKVYLENPRLKEQVEHIEHVITVSVKDKKLCPRYCARVIRNVKVGPSPLWMVRALESVGLRSINNIVDVTNYVLMELGHPLHAFDADQITDNEIIVRPAKAGEKFQTLDDQEIDLSVEDLVIADKKRPIALAGVMGGANSQVTDKTVTVILEAAQFDPLTVRRTSKRHGIITDSSQRFERGADPKMPPLAINIATQLIMNLSGGEVVKGIIDVQPTVTDHGHQVALRHDRIEKVLGISLPHTVVADLLVSLGCEIRRSDREQFIVRPPSWRVDLDREIDLIEEVARIHGYNKIPSTLPSIVGHPESLTPRSEALLPLRETLMADGFSEAVNFAFMSEELLNRAGVASENLVKIDNPLTQDVNAMRPTVIASLLGNAEHNIHRGAEDIRLFEIGAAHAPEGKDDFLEWWEATAIMVGGVPTAWNAEAKEHDFYTIKGVAERCLRACGVKNVQVRPLTDDERFHPKRSAALCQGRLVLAKVGEMHPRHLKQFNIERRVLAAEMMLEPLIERARKIKSKHVELSRHQSSTRDLAFVVTNDINAGDLRQTLTKASGDLLESIRLFDLYEGKGVGEGKRSLAYQLVFRAPDRTLVDEEIQACIDKAIAAAEKNHSAKLRV